ncbi:MAG: hypothetical protein QXZ02_06930, partial [Candidatus Bathyarchaeia archaeon]
SPSGNSKVSSRLPTISLRLVKKRTETRMANHPNQNLASQNLNCYPSGLANAKTKVKVYILALFCYSE